MENFLNSEVFEAFSEAAENVFLFATDMRINMARWSKSAIEYFGMPDEYMISPEPLWLEKVHPDDREKLSRDLDSVFSGEKNIHLCQYRVCNKYGQYVWLQCKGKMIYDETGRQHYFVGLMNRLDGQNKYDTLTGVLTYNEFYNYYLDESPRSVLLVGIDEFRKVINNYGYTVGDLVLAEAATTISKLAKENYRIYRFNGDEFIISMPEVGVEEAKLEFERFKDGLSEITLKDGRKVGLSISSGAIDYPISGRCREELISYLESSLDYAKKNKRGGIQFYTDKLAEADKRVELIKKDLGESIDNDFDGFELFYQPMVTAEDGKIIGCEALLRYKSEAVPNTYPSEFIPILEENGDIIRVGYWVMEQAIKQQSEWSKKFGDIKVSFNVSYQQFLDNRFVRNALKFCQKYGVNPSSMVIELTESSAVVNPHALAEIFDDLRQNGFKIALDDFGTAYASMELLKNLSADIIKIEHSFVRELSSEGHEIDFAIIESILMLCKKLGCISVVEGVENKDVEEIIKAMNANVMQGYFYSRPVNKQEFEKLFMLNK